MRMPCARCPCKSLNNRIGCIHSLKSNATANHLSTLINIYFFQNILGCKTITPPQPARHSPPIRKNFCGKSKAAHEFTRQFAPLRATLILSARTDRISTGYRAGHHMNSCSALRHSAPVRRPPRRRGRPSPSLPSPVMHREFSCPISPNLVRALLPVNPSNRPNKASDVNPI